MSRTHLSNAIATKCKIEAVHERTSELVHISHIVAPRNHFFETSL